MHNQEERVHKAYTSKDAKPGVVYFLIKDHKKVKDGDILPPLRQVCSAMSGPGSRLSNFCSTILNKAADSEDAPSECLSTEECKRRFLETNRIVRERAEEDAVFREAVKDLTILSMDVNGLYPSLVKDEVVPITYESLVRLQVSGNLTFEHVDFQEVRKSQ